MSNSKRNAAKHSTQRRRTAKPRDLWLDGHAYPSAEAGSSYGPNNEEHRVAEVEAHDIGEKDCARLAWWLLRAARWIEEGSNGKT